MFFFSSNKKQTANQLTHSFGKINLICWQGNYDFPYTPVNYQLTLSLSTCGGSKPTLKHEHCIIIFFFFFFAVSRVAKGFSVFAP